MTNLKSLPDTNVWLYVAAPHLLQHHAAMEWFVTVTGSTPACFCRATQLSFLRLLTQREAMKERVCTQRQAWARYDDLLSRAGISYLDEPAGIEALLRVLSSREEISPKRWADDYLAALAGAANLTLVTFDRALAARVPGATLLTP